MLIKRTNILFEEEMWEMLTALSEAKDISVGELVRKAVRDKYGKRKKINMARKAYDEIIKTRPKLKGPIDYKALIENGRRY